MPSAHMPLPLRVRAGLLRASTEPLICDLLGRSAESAVGAVNGGAGRGKKTWRLREASIRSGSLVLYHATRVARTVVLAGRRASLQPLPSVHP